MNPAAQRQQLAQKMELLQLLLSEHPDRAYELWAVQEVIDALDTSINKVSNAFPEHVLRGHFWFDTKRKEHVAIRKGTPYTYYDNKGGTIVCRLVTEPEKEFVGKSICMPTDTFNGVFGRTVALFRARSAAYRALIEKKEIAKKSSLNKMYYSNLLPGKVRERKKLGQWIVDTISEVFANQHGL